MPAQARGVKGKNECHKGETSEKKKGVFWWQTGYPRKTNPKNRKGSSGKGEREWSIIQWGRMIPSFREGLRKGKRKKRPRRTEGRKDFSLETHLYR